MDIYCPQCGEPLDVDELHEVEGMTFIEARDAFYRFGCPGIGYNCSLTPNRQMAMASAALHDVLGDDIDGIAAMHDDFGHWA